MLILYQFIVSEIFKKDSEIKMTLILLGVRGWLLNMSKIGAGKSWHLFWGWVCWIWSWYYHKFGGSWHLWWQRWQPGTRCQKNAWEQQLKSKALKTQDTKVHQAQFHGTHSSQLKNILTSAENRRHQDCCGHICQIESTVATAVSDATGRHLPQMPNSPQKRPVKIDVRCKSNSS